MSEREHEFIKNIKKIAGYFLGAIAVTIIGGSAMVYNLTIRTSEKVQSIQEDISEIKAELKQVRENYYFIQKK